MKKSTGHADAGAYVRRLTELDKNGLHADGGGEFNRLIFSGSPYLLQHAENPVDWFPWGEEAFAKALNEGKPLFLSIGYATCHWCHVMAHESFEDRDVAAVLNRHFISIKVDREERPDIDDRYMTVSRLMTGGGGWPLNIFLTPDKLPFLTVTYIPRMVRGGVPGIIGLLENVAALWKNQQGRVIKNCDDVMGALRRMMVAVPGQTPGTDLLDAAFRQLDGMFDPEWGGFGRAPKFPMPANLSFLLRYGKKSGSPRPRAMVEHTIRKMRAGGICDQIGFGFHRYSVDREWVVPHFEKMLYDQALLATACMETFRVTGEPFYQETAWEIFTFVLRELTSSDGGFFSALDADTEGEEGKYYVWTDVEIGTILGKDDGALFCRLFGITVRGNFEGANILHLPLEMEAFAAEEGVSFEDLVASESSWRERLLAEREKRVRPLRDEKIITAWNGLMIAALAEGYAATGDGRFLAAAERGAEFIGEKLTDPAGRLKRCCHNTTPLVSGFLEDYACYLQGLAALYEATLDKKYLDDALRLGRDMLRLFRDEVSGGLFDTGVDAEEVIVRGLDAADSVMPAANALAAGILVRLGRVTGDDELVAAGRGIVAAFIGRASLQPAGYLQLLTAREMLDEPPVEVTLAGRLDAPEIKAMLRVVGRRFIPNLVLRFEDSGDGAPEARVCAKRICLPPAASAAEMEKLLDDVT